MRTKPFTFKKTVKRTELHHAIECNFTVQEAADLREIIGVVAAGDDKTAGEFLYPLYVALSDFVLRHGGRPRIRMPMTTAPKAA